AADRADGGFAQELQFQLVVDDPLRARAAARPIESTVVVRAGAVEVIEERGDSCRGGRLALHLFQREQINCFGGAVEMLVADPLQDGIEPAGRRTLRRGDVVIRNAEIAGCGNSAALERLEPQANRRKHEWLSAQARCVRFRLRSEEHTSELQSLAYLV